MDKQILLKHLNHLRLISEQLQDDFKNPVEDMSNWFHKIEKAIQDCLSLEENMIEILIEMQKKNYLIDEQVQDKRWQALTEDGRQARIASYKELLKLQEEEADSYLITIEDLEKLYGKHNLQYQILTYEDVARELFKEEAFLPHAFSVDETDEVTYPLNCTSDKQCEKLLAINRLLNVAKFLNEDWKHDWENMTADDKVWSLGIDENDIRAYYVQKYDGAKAEIVYFRTEELAKQAIQILGEDTVRLALTTEY